MRYVLFPVVFIRVMFYFLLLLLCYGVIYRKLSSVWILQYESVAFDCITSLLAFQYSCFQQACSGIEQLSIVHKYCAHLPLYSSVLLYTMEYV